HQRIRPRAFAGQSEMRRRESIIEAKRQRRLGDDGELGRGRQRRADQRTEAKDQGGLRRKRIDTGGTFAVQQPDAQTDAAEESAQYALRQLYPRLADRTE